MGKDGYILSILSKYPRMGYILPYVWECLFDDDNNNDKYNDDDDDNDNEDDNNTEDGKGLHGGADEGGIRLWW